MMLTTKQNLQLIAVFWTILGLTFFGLGLTDWFHLPYLIYLDEWHFLWAMVSVCIGLITGWILDLVAQTVIQQSLVKTDINHKINFWQILGVKPLILLIVLIGLGTMFPLIGFTLPLQRLVDLALGTAFLWSCYRYWFILFSDLNFPES
ncbi:MAG: hypothetical protein ACKPEN_02755 [Planktothrix sp.]|uniref:hypothetical protein n=1 Tax=Planktothrix sp. TaxID=3088171 RepID=UPI0038D4EB66